MFTKMMKNFYSLLALILLVSAVVLCVQLISNARLNQKIKGDVAELNSIKYGMFSIDAWKGHLTPIVTAELDKLSVSDQTERELREHVAIVLNKMIDEAAAKIEQANRKTTGGKVKQAFIDMFVDIKDVKTGIPEYTDAVMRELMKPKTKRQIKSMLNKQVTEFATKTADAQDDSRLKAIVEEMGMKDVAAARAKLDESRATTQRLVAIQSALLIGLGIALFLLFAFAKPRAPAHFVILVLALVTLLAAGVATPMIDMEAKISKLEFMLIGHPILFEDQVLYFQSKSIMDVFWLMMTDDQIQMKLVAILVVSFSVIFPLLKVVSTVAYYFDFKGAKERAAVKFFVHHSGKWSMADVMVVAIFMAYIGFNGVISSQLKGLNFPDSGVDIIATNGTSLQPGYYVFVAFVMLSMLLSGMLKRSNLR